MFYLGKTSLSRLHRLHPKMAAVVALAITKTPVDFSVSETVRTIERQKELLNSKPPKTWTMNSKHLIQPSGFCHAVDLVPLKVGGGADWKACPVVAKAMFEAADQLSVEIRWGGDWNENGSSADEHDRGTYDGPHFELME